MTALRLIGIILIFVHKCTASRNESNGKLNSLGNKLRFNNYNEISYNKNISISTKSTFLDESSKANMPRSMPLEDISDKSPKLLDLLGERKQDDKEDKRSKR